MLLRPLAIVHVDASARLESVRTKGQVSTKGGTTRELGKVQIMGWRPGVPVLGSLVDIPFVFALLEVPPSMNRGYAQFDWPMAGERGPCDCCWRDNQCKAGSTSFRELVQEEIAVINLHLFNTSRRLGSYTMAENHVCV